MAHLPMTTNVRHVRQASIIDIQGDITAAAEETLMGAYNEANRSQPKAIIMNFSNLDYMNSTGIGLLVTLLIRANRQGQRILAVGLSDHYKQIFQLTRLDEAIQMCDSEADAVASAG